MSDDAAEMNRLRRIRDRLLKLILLILIVAGGICRLQSAAAMEQHVYPITGRSVLGMEEFEQAFSTMLQSNAIPGASLAIAKNGRLVYARGFGWANLERQEAVQPDSLFRIASIAKSLTAVAVLLLCQKQKLHLDQKTSGFLSGLIPCCLDQWEHRPAGGGTAGGATRVEADSRIGNITIRHLLNMTSGWQRLRSGDPIFSPTIGSIARRCSVTMRPEPKSVIRYVLSKPLDAYPGKDYAYGNVDYLVLGEVIRRASNQSYESYVRNSVLKPLGIARMKLGKTLLTSDHEVNYYGYPGEETFESVYPNIRRKVTAEYGGMFALESAPSSIGWIASSVDLLKLITGLSGERSIDSPLSQDSLRQMLSIPLSASVYKTSEYPNEFFAMGWEVDPANKPGKITFSRHGSLDGTMSFVMHRADGMSWSVLFNSRPAGYLAVRSLANEMIGDCIGKQEKWPVGDLFDLFD